MSQTLDSIPITGRALLALASNAVLIPAIESMRVVPDDPEAAMRDVATVEVRRGGRDAHIGIGRITADAGLRRRHRYWRRL